MSDTSDDYLFEDQQQPFVTDRRYQVRSKLDPKVVTEYAKAMKAGAKFPPITLA